jgi:hypothetical protein
METKITDSYFEYGNQKYFRGNAHLLQLGSYGEKKDPVGSKSYVDPQGKVKGKYLDNKRVDKGPAVSLNWSQVSKSSFEINGALKYFGKDGELKIDGSYQKAKSANLKLINFCIVERQLKSMLNTDADGTRKFMAAQGNDARIVSEVWIAMEAELAEKFINSTSGSLSLTGNDSGLKVSVSGGKSGSASITISPGTTFAYKLHKVKKWQNNKTKISDMEADYHGMS